MIYSVSLIVFYLLVPVFLIWLNNKSRIVNKIGPVLLSYVIGILIGNIGILPSIGGFSEIQNNLTNVTIPLAIPLLLFSLNIKKWFSMAAKAFLSMIIGVVGVIIMVFIGNYLFSSSIQDAWKIGGMLVGVYSGGTPNLAALQSALDVNPETYIMVNTIDIVLSTVFLLFLLTVGKNVLALFLPQYNLKLGEDKSKDLFENESYAGIFKKESLKDVLISIVLSLLIVVFSIGLSFLISGEISMLVIILSITSLGILLSFSKRINKLKYTFQLGMYFILVFCVVVASMANLKEIFQIAGALFKYISFVLFGSLFLHILLARIFKIDRDTLMVTSTALICSPPFVPVVAGVLKNKEIIISGLTVGIIGYAIGNYLGVTIAFVLK